jgi:hypothetical protein
MKYQYTFGEAIKTIIITGLLAGSLDILAACIDYYIKTGKGPEGVLRFIASGVFGKDAFTRTTTMIWFGLFFHFIIAFGLTIFFFIVYPKIKFLQINIILTAIIFGITSWLITNLIIVPLSNASIPFKLANAVKAALILIFAIGVPLSIIFQNFYRSHSKSATVA